MMSAKRALGYMFAFMTLLSFIGSVYMLTYRTPTYEYYGGRWWPSGDKYILIPYGIAGFLMTAMWGFTAKACFKDDKDKDEKREEESGDLPESHLIFS